MYCKFPMHRVGLCLSGEYTFMRRDYIQPESNKFIVTESTIHLAGISEAKMSYWGSFRSFSSFPIGTPD